MQHPELRLVVHGGHLQKSVHLYRFQECGEGPPLFDDRTPRLRPGSPLIKASTFQSTLLTPPADASVSGLGVVSQLFSLS